MNKYLLVILFAIWIMLFASPSVYPAVIWGIGELTMGGWDFSEQTSVPIEESDIFLAIVVDPPLGLVVAATNHALIAEIPDSTFDELKYAPADTSMYDNWAPASIDRVYVVKTSEGYYAKFRLLQLPYQLTIIEYVYQPDGSLKLFDPIGVENSTWGQVKKIFK